MTDTTEKYRTTPEHKAMIGAIALMRNLLSQHREEMEALVEAEEHMHNVGGLLDPTLYRDMLYSENLQRQMRMVRAALKFLAEIDAVAEEIEIEEAGR